MNFMKFQISIKRLVCQGQHYSNVQIQLKGQQLRGCLQDPTCISTHLQTEVRIHTQCRLVGWLAQGAVG
ncbi:hypothetical protein WJX79_000475 [Trebouxia sp. C0005]